MRIKFCLLINLKITSGTTKPVPAFGNLFLAIGYANILNSVGSPISAQLNVISDSRMDSDDGLMKSVVNEHNRIIQKFAIDCENAGVERSFKFSLPARLLWSNRMWLEHILPSLAYDAYMNLKPNLNFRFSKLRVEEEKNRKERKFIFWAYRKNELVTDRNSNPSVFLENFHFLIKEFPSFNILLGTSDSGLKEITKIVDSHSKTSCKCDIKNKIEVRRTPPSVESLTTILRAELFFTESLHGYCDFVFFSDVNFIIKANPYILHPRTEEVRRGKYYPWNTKNQKLLAQL